MPLARVPMAKFEATLQSSYGFVGPMGFEAPDPEVALDHAHQVVCNFFAGGTYSRLSDRPWMLILKGEGGDVIVAVPFYLPTNPRSARAQG